MANFQVLMIRKQKRCLKWSSLEGKRKVRGKLVRRLQARGHAQEEPGGACRKVTSHGDSGLLHLLTPGQSLPGGSSSSSHRETKGCQRATPQLLVSPLGRTNGPLGSGGTDHPISTAPRALRNSPRTAPAPKPALATGSHSNSWKWS